MLKFIFSTIAIASITGLWYLSPIKKPFPKLTGPYQVGLTTISFIDQNRIEKFSKNPTDRRTIVGHIFFPANNKNLHNRANYLGNKMPLYQKGYSEYFGFPEWITKLLFRNITTHAYTDATISQSKKTYPVIIFSHGLLGTPSDMYVVLLEELASHGYIVIGIDHPYFNWITQFPDGKTVGSNELAQQFAKMSPSKQTEFQSEAIAIYKSDINFFLDQLKLINEDQQSQFYNRLDLHNIGIMGHSAGGTAAIEFCRENNQCKAVIDLDGWYDQVIGHEPIEQPLLLLFGSKSVEITEPTVEYLQRKQLTREQYFEREQNISLHKKKLCKSPNCSMIILNNVEHGDFCDGILSKWPLRKWNDIDSYKTIALINKYILKFFNQHLSR